MTREEIIDAFAEAAHEAWLGEKVMRLNAHRNATMSNFGPTPTLTWPDEWGNEQLVPWNKLSEPVRDFDRIVVAAIYDVMVKEGLV